MKYQLSTINYPLSTIHYQLSTVNYQPSTINYQLSTVNYQLSTVNCQLSTINYQLSTINYQLSTIMTSLSQRIREFYDASSGLWEDVWGEHMHHGYYGKGGKSKINRRQAQIDLIEELLRWGGVKEAENILDVGCGIGGSTLYLADKFKANAKGITLSPVQASRGEGRANDASLSKRIEFKVADALNMPFPDNSFDLVWSLESGEHMPDKLQFLQECYRVLKPGGTFLMATWCHRSTDSLAGALTADEKKHLADIYRVYCLPYVISLPEYETYALHCNFQNIQVDDWSIEVAPFWNVVIDSAFNPKAIVGLVQSGWPTIEAAFSLGLMSRGYERGLIRFGVLSANKEL